MLMNQTSDLNKYTRHDDDSHDLQRIVQVALSHMHAGYSSFGLGKGLGKSARGMNYTVIL